MTRTDQGSGRTVRATLLGVGLAIGVLVAVLVNDVILGVLAGSAFVAVAVGMVRLWTGDGGRRPRHP